MIEKRMFLIELDHNKALDIGDLTHDQWKEIEKRSQQVIRAGQTKNNKIAFVAAFLNYVSELQSSEIPLSEVN